MPFVKGVLMLFEEGEKCKTLGIIVDGKTVFNRDDEVKILRAIPAQPGHPYNGYFVFSPILGRTIELQEGELDYL